MIEVIDELLHKWGASERHGLASNGISIAYALMQTAPPVSREDKNDPRFSYRYEEAEIIKQRVNERVSNMADSQAIDQRTAARCIKNMVDIEEIYKPARQQQTRSRKIDIVFDDDLQEVDKIISKLNKRFKQTARVVYVWCPNIGRKEQAKKLRIHENTLYNRLNAIHSQVFYSLSEK